MNKTAIKNFAIWARNKLIADICYRAGLMGITEKGIADPLPQSTLDAQFYDIGAAEPYLVAGEAIKQRRQLVEVIRDKEKDSDYRTAYQYVMEEVAYTWFNRLIAVRFMEVNDYLPSHLRVLSSESGKVEPDLVTTPFDADLPFTAEEEAQIIQWKQDNKLDELFRFLFIKQCNALNEILPGLFEKTTDYTEVLLNLSVVDQEGVVYKLKGSGTYFRREKVMSQELNTGKAPLKIGLVLQGQDTSANSGLIDGIRSVLEPDRVDLHVFLTDNKFYYERRCLETVAHQNFQGFIVDGVKASILSPNLDCYKELYRRKIPVIFYNNFYKNLRCPRVIINDRDCARQLLARLIDAGHKNIAGIFFYDNYASVEKFQGMAEAMQERSLEMKDHYIKWCVSDEARQDSYVRSIEKFLKGLPKCTAIVCCNYIVYRHVRNALDRMGKQIPADYSLVCFDYSADTYRQEGVTCSVEQGFEMGRQVALRLIENGDCDDKNYTAVLKPILYDGNSIRNR